MPDLAFSPDYEIKLLPGKAASLRALKGLARFDFPADSHKEGVFISIREGSRLADRPLPNGLSTYFAFTLDGSVIGQPGVSVGELDKPFNLGLSLENRHLPAGLKLFRWNNAIPNWEEISPSMLAQSDLLTDYAVGGPPRERRGGTFSTSSDSSAYPRAILTLPSGKVDYLGGYLSEGGLSAAGAEDGAWRPANIGYLNTEPLQLVQSSEGTFYSLGEDGVLRRSVDGFSWTTIRGDNPTKFYIAQIATKGSTLYGAMDTNSNKTIHSGVYKSTDRGTTWDQIYLPPIPDGATDQHFKGKSINISEADNQYLWFTALADFVTPVKYKAFVSGDGGATWTPLASTAGSTPIQQVVPDRANANRAFMIKSDGLYRTTDYGSTFTKVLTTTVSMASLENFAQDPGDNAHKWFVSGDNGIWESVNGGQTWTHTDILPAGSSGQVSVVAVGLDRSVYAGIDATTGMPTSNLYKSTYSNGTWSSWANITGDMNTDGSSLKDSTGPLRIRAIIPQTNAPDEGSEFGIQPDNSFHGGVHTTTGNYFYSRADFSVDGKGPAMVISRYYNSKDRVVSPFGRGWGFSYGMKVTKFPNGMVLLHDEAGRHVEFIKKNDGTYMAVDGIDATFYDNHGMGYVLTLKDRTVYNFDGATGVLTSIVDHDQNPVNFTYNAEKTKLQTIEDAAGRQAIFTYTGDKVTRIDLPLSRSLLFSYTGDSLTSFTNMEGEVTTYGYDGNGYLTTITDALGHTQVTNTYDASGRVTAQEDADQNETTFQWDYDGTNTVAGYTTITDPRGATHIYRSNPTTATLDVEDAYGNMDLYTWNSNRAMTNHTDRNGNRTRMSWDSLNNMTGTYDAETQSHNFTYNFMSNPTEERWTVRDEAPPANLAPNSNFELDDNGDDVPNGWTPVLATGTPAFSMSSYYQRYGTNALMISAGENSSGFYQSNPIAVNGATSYALSYDVMTINLVPARTTYPCGVIIVTELDANQNALRDQYLFTGLSGTLDWNRKAGVFTTNGSTRYVLLRPVLGYGGEATGTVLFDGVLLEQGTAASKYWVKAAYGYGSTGNLTSIENSQGKTTSIGRNTDGSVSSVVDPMATATYIDYDPDGNPEEITDGDGKIWTRVYDEAGRMLSQTDPLSHTVSYEYDNENRQTEVTDALNHSTFYTYDDTGNALTVTDANQNVTTYVYDLKNNLNTITDSEGNTTTYDYNWAGQIISVTDALLHTTTYEYNLEGRQTKTTTHLGKITEQEYSPVGNVTSITDANDATTTLTYDKVGKLKTKTYPDNTSVSYTYNHRGLRKSMTDASGTTTYSYDDEGRLKTVTTSQGTVTYDYDDSGRLTDITYPDSKHVKYSYNHRNLLTKVEDWASPARVTNYTYDNAGRLATAGYPNTTSMVYSYNNANAVTGIDYKRNGTTFQSVSYQLDNVGNRTRVTDTVGGVDHVRAFTYDDNYRLTYADYNYDSNPNGKMEAFEYDAVGNRTVLTETVDLVDTVTSYTYDDDNRMLTAGSDTFTWDDNGNMTSKTSGGVTTNYAYSYEDQLKTLTKGTDTYQYTYNADGLRTKEVKNGVTTNYTWDMSKKVPEVITAGNTNYLYGLDLISSGQAGVITFYYQDALGSNKILADINGSVTANYYYKAFGNILSQSGTASTSLKFAGEQLDDTGLYYLRARYYDPITGRFLSKDPIGTVNPYLYAVNSPTQLVDPRGTDPVVAPAYPPGSVTIDAGLWPQTIWTFIQWLYEIGAPEQNFGADDAQTKEIARSRGMQQARCQYAANGYQETTGSWGTFEAWGEFKDNLGGPNPRDMSTVDMTGAYSWKATPNGDGTVTYEVWNTMSVNSFFYHQDWATNRERGIQDGNFGMGNMVLHYTWVEKNPPAPGPGLNAPGPYYL